MISTPTTGESSPSPESAQNRPYISVQSLWKVFGKNPELALESPYAEQDRSAVLRALGCVVALKDVNFSVEKGETFVVMGLSGSGKSTLIRCINRLFVPTAGRVLVDDEDVMSLDEEGLRDLRRTKMSMVFQHFALFPHKTVLDNVEYGLKVRNVSPEERREKALETLSAVGLDGWGDRYPENLSGGMQQRVGLARALATDPEILLMDEAFSALDPLIRKDMQDELIELQRSVQKTIIFISHDLGEALKLGDRVAVMKDGMIVQIGTPEEIVSSPADEYVAAFTQDVDRGRVFTLSSIMREVETLVQGHDTVTTAMFRMRESRDDNFYVVEPHHHHDQCLGGIVGLATRQDIAKAVREGVKDLSQIVHTDIPKAAPSTPLVDVYTMFSSGLPVAVVDEQDCFYGEVDQLDLLANLSPDNSLSDEGAAEATPHAKTDDVPMQTGPPETTD